MIHGNRVERIFVMQMNVWEFVFSAIETKRTGRRQKTSIKNQTEIMKAT